MTVNGSTISFNVAVREEVLTLEDSAALFPACAEAGITLPRRETAIPPMEIRSYDSATGHLTFFDPRRPEDINCMIVTVLDGAVAPRLNVQALLTTVGVDSNDPTLTPFRCVAFNDLCVISTTAGGSITVLFDLQFNIPCTGGACMQ